MEGNMALPPAGKKRNLARFCGEKQRAEFNLGD
jgi:hypothetical protein